jgi:ABC-2 type transport system ATP-binding protein
MLELKNISKAYGDKTIISVPELKIPEGIFHIKGINGSGKTTFSKILAGLIPYKGKITLHGNIDPVKDLVRYRHLINFGESEPKYPGFLTARDLIEFVAKAKNAPEGQKNILIETFEINNYFKDPCETYSSGMLKRLSLALAFLGNPALIILDEPFNTLDTDSANILADKISHLHSSKNISFILSSHQPVTARIYISSVLTVSNHLISFEDA